MKPPIDIPIESQQEENSKKVLTYFLLFFPTLIIAGIPSVINGSVITSMVIKMLIAFLQFVALKNFVDQYYK